jgi:DNA-binding CsgD family transcriptional regulator
VTSDEPASLTAGVHALVDRDADVARMDTLLDGALQGDGALLIFEGPAGIGKSALLSEARVHAAARGARVLRARGGELEREFGFGVVRQLFETLLADPAVRERRLAGAAATAAAVFLPPGSDSEQEGGSFAALHGLYWLAADLAADGPLMLAIDDLHWCDAASLRFLAYLAVRLEGLPIFLATALRSGEPVSDERLIAAICSEPATLVSLAPLTPDASAALVRRQLSADAEDAFCSACHAASGGNPLLLGQLLGALQADAISPLAAQAAAVREIGPRAVSRSVLLRLARMPVDSRELAQAVSILGDDAPLDVAGALAGLDHERAAAATGPLVRAEILADLLPLSFVHPLVRDAIYHELSGGERALRHARAAELLRGSDADVEQLAAQLLLAPPRADAAVAELLHDAARDAVGRGAPESAVAYLRRALAEPAALERRPALLHELGRIEVLTDGASSAVHLREACDTLADPAARIDAAQRLARVLILLNRPVEAQDLAGATRRELPVGDVDQRSTFEALERMAFLFGGRPPSQPSSMDGRGGGLGSSVGEKRILAVTALERCFAGDSAQECCDLAFEALADGILIPADDTFLMCAPAIVLLEADRPEVMDVWEQASRDAHRRGSLFGLIGTNLWRGNALLRNGELLEAEASLERAAAAMRQWGDVAGIGNSYLSAFQAEVCVERGAHAQAWTALQANVPDNPSSDAQRLWQGARIRLLMAENRNDDALEAIDSYRRMLEGLTNPAWNQWRSLRALVLVARDQPDEALELMRSELGDAERWGAPGTIGRSLRILGEIERDEALLRDAVGLLERSTARLEHARALLALGIVIRQDRRPSQARDPLRAALELATACSCAPVIERARSELLAAGARPRATALSGVNSLTPSERRIAELAAEGATNRDIAQQQFVTTKTVEVHLSNAYRKLGIASRRELLGALSAKP